MTDELQTRQTLLARAKDPDDHLAWDDFVEYYAGFIQMLMWKMNIPQSEHEDLKQEILLKIWAAMQNFEHDHTKAKFRTWLATIVRNGAISYMRSYRAGERREQAVDSQTPGFSPSKESSGELDELINREWAHYMVDRVIEHLRQFFSGKAIDVFLMSHEGKKAQEISEKLEIPVNTVYVLRNRVKVRFMSEIKTLRSIIEF